MISDNVVHEKKIQFLKLENIKTDDNIEVNEN